MLRNSAGNKDFVNTVMLGVQELANYLNTFGNRRYLLCQL